MRKAAFAAVFAILGGLCALGAPSFADGSERVIRGRVVDGGGKGVEGAEVATAWRVGASGARPLQGARTDADGRFSLPCAYLGETAVLLAYDAPRARGGFLEVEPARWAQEQTLALSPLTEVRGKLSVEGGKFYPSGGVAWLGPRSRPNVLRIDPEKGALSVRLPAGAYLLTAQAPVKKPRTEAVTVPGGKPDAPPAPIDLGTFDLEEREGRVETGELAPPFSFQESAPALDALLRDGHVPARWTLLYFWDST